MNRVDYDGVVEYELGFIGGGNMAEAMVRAAVDCDVIPGDQIIVSDPSKERRDLFADLGIAVRESNADVVADARQIVLAVKPQMLEAVAGDLKRLDAERQVLISILAGVTIAKLEQAMGKPCRVIRVMPNTPLLVGAGMSAVAVGPHARAGDELLSMQILKAGGEVVRVDESLMDAVTAVSGSGPAYLFYLAEGMIEAARGLGLSEEQAVLLTKQTMLGAAKLLKESCESATELRRRVTSPGGTTEAALEQMESNRVKETIVEAIRCGAERCRELGR